MSQALRVRVYLEDTDAGGIVYHASYLRLMERARTEFLRARGLEQSRTYLEDVGFVVHSLSVRFLRPARLDDELIVTCEPKEFRAASIVFQQYVSPASEKPGEEAGPYARAEVTVACVSLADGKAQAVPDQMLAQLQAPD